MAGSPVDVKGASEGSAAGSEKDGVDMLFPPSDSSWESQDSPATRKRKRATHNKLQKAKALLLEEYPTLVPLLENLTSADIKQVLERDNDWDVSKGLLRHRARG